MYMRRFALHSPEIYVNADVAKDGEVRLELLDGDCQTIPAAA
ncbi:hypothetical protein [Candidatus Entotheonella palauensis]|nr:hypothetical protein [Candidatus Entotheonella palauensis]